MTDRVDLFDVYNLGDIPQEIREWLNQDCFAEEIISLFRLAGDRKLTTDEIVVAHYRKFVQGTGNPPRTKKQITAKLYRLCKDQKSPVEFVDGKKGTYRLKEEAIEEELATTEGVK